MSTNSQDSLMYFQSNAVYGLNKRTPAATKISISAFNGPRNSELEERFDRQLLLEPNEPKENFTQGTHSYVRNKPEDRMVLKPSPETE